MPPIRAVAVLAAAVLAGCGGGAARPTPTPATPSPTPVPGSTVTITDTTDGFVVATVVVTSDAAAIAQVKQRVDATTGRGLSVADGDHHSGPKVCSVDRAKDGHRFAITVYGLAPATTCTNTGMIDAELP